jgi:hypothetical protein
LLLPGIFLPQIMGGHTFLDKYCDKVLILVCCLLISNRVSSD